MPPVMEPATEQRQVLCRDEQLQGLVDKEGHSNYNLVFTDISSGFTDRVTASWVATDRTHFDGDEI